MYEANVLFYSLIIVDNPDLKAGVASLSRLLSLPEHPDHFVLLQVSVRVFIRSSHPTTGIWQI